MATDATGTPTSLGIPTLNVGVDAPTGNGENAMMAAIDALLVARTASLTSTGDILYASGANTPARLAIGSTGNVLTVSGGLPSWVAITTAAYTDYTPTWTSSGVAPAIGNAVVTARYAQTGKMIHCYGLIVFGSSSTFGSGNYFFALPATSVAQAQVGIGGSAYLYDGTNEFAARPTVQTGTTMNFIYPATYGGAKTIVGQTTPWTWASTKQLSWNFMYEAA